MKPDEVLALVTDLKESLEELYKKMADKSAQRQKLSMIGMSGKGSDAGEDMRSADASQSPDLEGGDDCFQEEGDETLLDQRGNCPSSALWLRSTETFGGSV